MNLLGAILYDPAAAVIKNTTALLAMTALDTTNLRIAFTIPQSGMVRVRMTGVIHGAATFPSVLLGVMNGATVVGRVAPVQSLGNTAVATALVNIEADFIIGGLAPGDVSWDAAYGVKTLIAATGIKYGGPNNTTANNAFGGFGFEIWDPRTEPTNFGLLSIDANGSMFVKLAAVTHTGAVIPTVTTLTNMPAAPDNTSITAIKAKTDNLPAAPASTTNITAATGIVLSGVTHTGAVIPTVTTLTNMSPPAVSPSKPRPNWISH